jgi:DNA-directed RNA polymerase delta subunit
MPTLNFSPKQRTKKILKDLNERSRYVVVNRFGLEGDGNKQTLEAIGQKYDITRERVRQIENVALKAIRKSESFAEAREIFDELKMAMNDYGGLVAHEEFLNELSNDPVVQNHLHFYLVLGDDFLEHKENKNFAKRWTTDKALADKVHAVFDEIYRELKKTDTMSEDDLVNRIGSHDHLRDVDDVIASPRAIRHWLNLSKKIQKNPMNEYGRHDSPNVSMRGIRDMAYLVMRKHGSPLHFTEVAKAIEESFGREAHTATCHNELIKDKRFVLVGRGLYALKEWGYRTGIVRDIIKDIIREEGPLTKDEIVDRVLKERYLKENTISVNLQNKKHFYRDADGRYNIVE